jgi:hypothetical protein
MRESTVSSDKGVVIYEPIQPENMGFGKSGAI